MVTFQFVENDKINSQSRKLIRSHVMKGKNTGKTKYLSTSSRVSNARSESTTSDGDSQSSSEGASCGDHVIIPLERPLGDDLGYLTFPYPIERRERQLMQQFLFENIRSMYPPELCISADHQRKLWMSYIQSSETFLHCSLVMATISIDSLLGKPPRSPQALRHLANTYQCFKRDLQQHSTPSDPTLAVVVSLAVHENLTAQFGVSKLHLQALHQMLELRGGIEEIASNWVLWHKFCRSDIDRALHECCVTLFYSDCLPHLAVKSTNSALMSMGCSKSSVTATLDISSQLKSVAEEMSGFCRLLDRDPAHFGVQPSTFQGALISFAYRLLQIHPLSQEPPPNHLEHALHITLLGFLTTILFEYGTMHSRPYDMLADRIRDAVSGLMTTTTLKQQPILLWILFAGGIALLGPQDESWLFPCITSCLSALNINNWKDARNVMPQLQWVRVVHDRPACKLWQAVTGLDERP